MTTFLAIVSIVAGVLQIVLFFKIWGMTNNVGVIKDAIWDGNNSASIILDGQVSALAGDNEMAIKKYKEAFFKDVLLIYNEVASNWGEANKQVYREKLYTEKYNVIVSQYEKRIEKVGGSLEADKYDTFIKVRDIISNI